MLSALRRMPGSPMLNTLASAGKNPDEPKRSPSRVAQTDEAAKSWIAVGPNGTDVSGDDGRTWIAVKPKTGEPQDADQNWNALSLPFAVGQDGRIGKWARPGAVTH